MAETIKKHFTGFGSAQLDVISMGFYHDLTDVHKFGSVAALGTAYETIWTPGGQKTYRTTATVFNVSSSSAADTATGTGAQTVTLYGVDGNWANVEQTVSLTGQTLATVANMMICDRMIVNTGGSGETNAGTIYAGTGLATLGVPAVIENQIAIGEAQTESCFYVVRANTEAYLVEFEVSVGTGKILTSGIYAKPLGGVFNLRGKRLTNAAPTAMDFRVPKKYAEKTIIEVRGKVDSTTAAVTADFELVIRDLNG